MTILPGAEATSTAEKSSRLHPCRFSTNMTAKAASKAATMITDGLDLQSLQGIGRA